MYCKTAIWAAILAGILACGAARAADDDTALLPFLDDNSFLVVRLDEPALDIRADIQWLTRAFESARLDPQALEAIRSQIAVQFNGADEWTGKFRAAGGKRLYFVLSLSDLPGPGPFIVVPLEGGADGAALAAVFQGSGQEHGETIGGAMVFGNDKTRERLKAMPRGNVNPDFARAMAAVGNVPARAVLIPSANVRTTVEMVAPKLPPALGGGPINDLSRGVQWAAIGMTTPPEPSMKLIVQARDAATAQNLLKLEGLSVKWAADNATRAPFDMKRALSYVTVGVEGDRLVLSLSTSQIRDLITSVLAPAMANSFHQVAERPSAENISLIALGCNSYSMRNKQKWPDTLDQIAGEVGGNAKLNALRQGIPREGYTPQYVYRKPTDTTRRFAEIIVLYETFEEGKAPARVAAAFADGHVEFMDAAELKHRLETLGGR